MEKWYEIENEKCLEKLNSKQSGLTNDQVRERLESQGYNRLKEIKKKTLIARFIDQFKNVMILVLIAAAILSAFVSIKEGEPLTDTIIIFVVVLLNALLGVIQESKAEKAIEALKDMSLPYINVKRDDMVQKVKVEELVVGDIVLVEAGDTVPADIRILESHSLRIEEAALTGESVPVDKQANVLAVTSNTPLGDRINMMYSGSNVVYGRGMGIVVATGMDTEIGKIATAISSISAEETPLQKRMREISKILTILVLVIATIMFVVGLVQGKEVLDVFMLAIALAVAAIPEGLAAVITITLAMGVQKMAKKNAIIRKLSAVEALGSTEIICSDKTGTLTQNKMTVKKLYLDGNVVSSEQATNVNEVFLKLLALCNDVKFTKENGVERLLGDPTEIALVELAAKLNVDKKEYEQKYKRVEEAPFDSERKMMTTVLEQQDNYLVCTKGAIESLLPNCTHILIDGVVTELTQKLKKQIEDQNLQFAKEAYRVLAYAYKIQEKCPIISSEEQVKEVERELVFAGLTAMIDPPREEVKAAVEECFRAGIIPIMITGDNIDTATAIAKELGILKEGDKALTGVEVDALSDQELSKQVNFVKVYARVSPENKIRIVRAWKKLGKIVAMTGDGVNDAPALKGADIGVGMGITGTEVSKSVSSMVLADDNFATIVAAVKEGRRIYTNIQNVIAYLLASNLAEVIIIFIGMLFSRTLLIPIQILWINLISDTIPAIALGFEKEEKGIMDKKPRKSTESFFTPFLTARIIVPAILKSIIVFITYVFIEKSYGSLIASSTVFVLLSIIEMLFAFVSRSDKKTILSLGITSNKIMFVSIAATIFIQIAVILIPFTNSWLGIGTLPNIVYVIIAVIAVASFGLFETVKIVLYKVFNKE